MIKLNIIINVIGICGSMEYGRDYGNKSKVFLWMNTFYSVIYVQNTLIIKYEKEDFFFTS